MITKELLEHIIKNFALDPWGLHGISHWARVLENGRLIAKDSGAKVHIVELFAVLHDSKRWNDSGDRHHGKRAAEFVDKLQGKFFNLSNEDLMILKDACKRHNYFAKSNDVTVQTCWDADRLDLLRALIIPDPKHLFTEFAKNPETIQWANQRSKDLFEPYLIRSEWGL